MIRLATIGTSKIAEEFVTAALKSGKYTLCAVYSRKYDTGKAFADKFACKNIFVSLDELAKSDIADSVYIASPNVLHFEQSLKMLNAGKNVICEKTLTADCREFDILKNTAQEKGVIFTEAIMSAHSLARGPLKTAVSGIGNIAVARLDFCKRSARYDDFAAGKHTNIFDMSLHAGALMDIGVYCVWTAVDLFGMPEKISATASFLNNGADGSGCAIFDYGKFSAVLTYSKTAQSAIGSEIIGDKGTVKIGRINQYTDISLVADNQISTVYGSIPKTDVMMGEADDFADYVSGKNIEEYKEFLNLSRDVLACMEQIKLCAGITYN